MDYKRITLIAGHYGSGKTNVAVNFAMSLKEHSDKVMVADLDIVNPYFRSKDSLNDFNDLGIRLVCSEYANTNVDIPALPQEIYAITDDKSYKVIVDVGGDDRGALALGRLAPEILKENDYQMLMVVNKYRPLTKNVDLAIEVMKEIEDACKIPFTGIVNNSNLGEITTVKDVIDSISYAEEISKRANIPLVFTTVDQKIYNQCKDNIKKFSPTENAKKDSITGGNLYV